MSTWQISATRKLISNRFGAAQLLLANPSIRSVLERLDYASFHYHEAKTCFRKYVEEELSNKSLFEAVYSDDDEGYQKLESTRVRIGASVLGCIQSLHAIADIAAHVIYYSLGLNLCEKPIEKIKVNHSSVIKLLSETKELDQIRQHLTNLVECEDFKHIAALTNLSKHRSIIAPAFSEDQTSKVAERHWLQFDAFTLGKKSYPKVDVIPLLEREFNRINRCYVDLGNALHRVLLNEAP